MKRYANVTQRSEIIYVKKKAGRHHLISFHSIRFLMRQMMAKRHWMSARDPSPPSARRRAGSLIPEDAAPSVDVVARSEWTKGTKGKRSFKNNQILFRRAFLLYFFFK